MRPPLQLVLGLGALLALASNAAHAQDRDGDRVDDALDLCPDVRELDTRLFPGDGCPDRDADGDRVVDDYDVCADAAETANGLEDGDGCPDVDASALRGLVERVHFETGEHTLSAEARSALDGVAAFLAAHEAIAHAEIDGHADARGDDAANLALSQRRAEAVRDALVARGVAASRLSAVGRGALPGDSIAVQTENRRCDVRVTVAGRTPPPLDAEPIAGRWHGASLADLELREHASEARLIVQAGAPSWMGPADATLDCYAGRHTDARWALHCRGVEVDVTLVLRAVDADHLVGFVEARSAAGLDRAPWTATRVVAFDRVRVVRMIQSQRHPIQECYARVLVTSPTAMGRVVVQFTIQPTGETDATALSDEITPPAPAIAACMVRIFDTFVFRPGPVGGPVTFAFPFVFEPGG